MMRSGFARTSVAGALVAAACAGSSGGTTGPMAGGNVDAGGEATIPDGEGGSPSFEDPYGGASGCSGGIAASSTLCEIAVPLSGGLSGMLEGKSRFGCVWSNSAPPASAPLAFGTYGAGPPPWASISLTFTPMTPVVPGQVGPLDGVSLLLVANGTDGGKLEWSTPPSCQLRLTSNACVRGGAVGEYAISGTGQCDDPAQPIDGNTLPAVRIGNLQFALEYTAPSAVTE
jgi:hypothetical protein